MTRDRFYYLLSFTCLVIVIGWLLFVTDGVPDLPEGFWVDMDEKGWRH
jgi:hypothetical protein